MSKTKKILIWSVVAVAVVVGIVFYSKSKKPEIAYTTVDATRGKLTQTVSVTGDLVAENEITLNFELGGRVSKVFVKESDQVAVGDKIATLTDANLQKQVDQAKAALDQAVAGSGSNNDTLREAKVAKENAENTLDETKDLNDESVSAAKQTVENAEKYLTDAQALYDGSSTPTNKLTLTTAQNNLEAAKKAFNVAQQQAQLSKTNAENTLETAKAKVETVESNYALRARNAQVAGARAAYELALINLNKATLISPVNGIITEVNNKPGEVLGTGVIKEAFSRVMSLDMIIESKVPESDVVKVKLGQKAKVTLDALSENDIFEGEVIEIDPASTTIQDVVYYTIKLKLINTDSRIKPGMSANIDVATAEKNDVVMVPMRAIKTEDDKKYVEILLADNATKKVYVETGLQGDEGMIEIKSGLSGGEKVVTFVATK